MFLFGGGRSGPLAETLKDNTKGFRIKNDTEKKALIAKVIEDTFALVCNQATEFSSKSVEDTYEFNFDSITNWRTDFNAKERQEIVNGVKERFSNRELIGDLVVNSYWDGSTYILTLTWSAD